MTEDFFYNRSTLFYTRMRFFLIFLLIILSDQITKYVILDLIFYPPRLIEILPILNFVPVWNRGISFGMLANAGEVLPFILIALACVVSAWLFWMLSCFNGPQRFSAALIAGGAIGNAIDRLRFGQVVDFIDLHYDIWHWPAFNLADAMITLGAFIWGYSIFFVQEASRR